MDGRLEGWMDGRIDGWMLGWMDTGMDDKMHGWISREKKKDYQGFTRMRPNK